MSWQVMLLTLAALPCGFGLGLLHFRSLARVAQLLTEGRMLAVVWQGARMVVLVGFFVLAALAGAPVLGAGFVGIMLGRHVALRGAAA